MIDYRGCIKERLFSDCTGVDVVRVVMSAVFVACLTTYRTLRNIGHPTYIHGRQFLFQIFENNGWTDL